MIYPITSAKPEPEYFGNFKKAFREHVHILIAWGHRDSHSLVKSDSEEPVITGLITKAVKDIFRAPNCPGWCKYYSIMENPPEEFEEREGDRRPKPDIIIEGHFPGRPEYIFEAKRLRNDGFGVGKYTGPEGLGCFVSGKYASRYNEAAMLGYVQSDTPEKWKIKIQKSIEKETVGLHTVSSQRDIRVIEDIPLEWVSEHNREKTGRSISVFHILLDYRAHHVARG